MLKKPFSKLLSVLLTIAICATTVFGCFVTVTAEQNKPSYVITGAQCETGDTVASAFVTFNVPNGAVAGLFTIDNPGNWYSSVAVSRYSELAATDDNFVIDNDNGNVLLTITDSNDNAKLYTTFVLKLDFVFSGAGITDDINISISNLEFNGIYSDDIYTDFVNNSTNAIFTAGCQHKFVVNGEAVYSSNEYDYTVYPSATCSVCGEVKNDYQVVPAVGQQTSGIVDKWDGRDENGNWIGWTYNTFSGGTGTKDDPFIIKYAEQLAYLTTAGASTAELTTDMYYKVDSSIKAFDMNTTGLNLSGTMTPQQVKELLADEIVGRSYWAAGIFAGHFDGNGVEIYGLHSGKANYSETNSTGDQVAGLFPIITAGASIKNVVLKNSYFYTGGECGGLIGRVDTNSDFDTITIENCVVRDCYIECTKNGIYPGIIAGNVGNSAYFVGKNILVYGNEVINASNSVISIVGTASKCYIPEGASSNVTNNRLYDSVIFGAAPYDAKGSWWFKACDQKIFQNVYFDNTIATSGFGGYGNSASKLTQLSSVDAAKGDAAITNMPDLDWNTSENPNGIWFTGPKNQYPTLLHKASVTVAGSSDNDWKLLGVNLVYKNNGGFAINFHYEPAYDADVKLYLTSAANDGKVMILDNPTTSSLAGGVLPTGTKMFTVDNLSARDIDVLWLATIVTDSQDGGCKVYGETKQISIGDYAEDVVCGNAFYDESATETNKIADKTVAAALINYGLASNSALSVDSAQTGTTATIVEKWDQYENGKYVGWYNSNLSGLGTKESPLIIDTAEKLAWVCKETTVANSAGVYYKVADNIKAFDMNTVAGVDLTDDSLTATQAKNLVAGKILGKVWHPGYSGCFAGNFDGNGVTIYGLYAGPAYYNQSSYDNNAPYGCEYAGLFSVIDASTATFKNFTIKNSYFTSNISGAVYGRSIVNDGSALIENVVVANCYLETKSDTPGGVMVGKCDFDATNVITSNVLINNCLVYGNVVVNKNGNAARLVGTTEAYCNDGNGGKTRDYNGFSIKNTIAIDCAIENSGSWWQQDSKFFTNCYTTETPHTANTTITKLPNDDAAKGIAAKVNMPALDWDCVWMYGNEGEYPSIVLTEGKVNPISIYSGVADKALKGSGTEKDPYLITNADELYAVLCGNVDSAGLYFKVADGIKAFYMNGGSTVAAMTSAEEVKAYFAKNAPVYTSANKPFQGTFDGNNATVYGAASSGWNAALFPQTTGAATIKNITVKNSYFTSSGYTGGLVGGTWISNIATTSLTIENCIIANCYIYNSHASNSSGAMIGQFGSSSGSPILTVDNCMVYGNMVVGSSGVINGAITGVSGGINNNSSYRQIRNSVFLGISPATGEYWSGNCTYNPIYTNCYTDTAYTGANAPTYVTGVLEKIAPNDAKGLAAKTAMPLLNWENKWYVGNYNEYPSFTPAATMPTDIQSKYENVEFSTTDKAGSNVEYHANGSMSFGVYQTALSLKANPYMSFAFAFLGEYKTNRDKIKIRFTYTENGTTKTSDEISVPAYTGEDIKNVNGWTNTTANGRYHTYKAENIPVEALAYGIKVEASYNGGAWLDFGTYSVSGLGQQFERLNRITPCEYYDTRVEATKALLFYAQAIAARYGA